MDSKTVMLLLNGLVETVYMTLVSTALGYLIGLPIGILLTVTDKEGIHPNALVYRIMDVIINIMRSIPFLILLILLIPFTRFLVGKSYGTTATIVPLVVSAAPYIARMVESSRGKDISDYRRDHHARHDPRILRHGGYRCRRRTWRHRDPVWILPLED